MAPKGAYWDGPRHKYYPFSCCSHRLCLFLKNLLSSSYLFLHWKYSFHSIAISTPCITCSNNGQAWFHICFMQPYLDIWDPLITQLPLMEHVQISDHSFLFYYCTTEGWISLINFLLTPRHRTFFSGCTKDEKVVKVIQIVHGETMAHLL